MLALQIYQCQLQQRPIKLVINVDNQLLYLKSIFLICLVEGSLQLILIASIFMT